MPLAIERTAKSGFFGPAALFLLGALATPANAASLCIAVDTAHAAHTDFVVSGDSIRITFTHSIYDSRVEERFSVGSGGFVAVDAQYSERRLVDFYGHESARREGEWWVVRLPYQEFPTLTVRASSDAVVRLMIGARTIAFTNGVARLAPGPCSRATSHD